MPQRTNRSQQTIRVGIAAANYKRARHTGPSSPQPELPVHLPAGFGGPSAGSGIENLAKADAVAAVETRNALDRAEEETFSNSEPEGLWDSESESEFGAVISPNEPEGDSSSDDSGDSELDGELPLAQPAKAAEFSFQNPTTAEEWKVAEACPPGNKWTNPSATSVAEEPLEEKTE